MDGRFDRNIVFAFIQIVENPAEINKGAVCPIVFIYDLELQIDNSMIVQFYLDIKEECFLVYTFSEFDRIADFDRENRFNIKVQQRSNQQLQGKIVYLKHCAEQIIIGHSDGKWSMEIVQIDVRDLCTADVVFGCHKNTFLSFLLSEKVTIIWTMWRIAIDQIDSDRCCFKNIHDTSVTEHIEYITECNLCKA